MLIPVNDLEEFHEKVLQVFEKALRINSGFGSSGKFPSQLHELTEGQILTRLRFNH